MAKKRGNNEGSIYRRKNGTWRAQVTISGYRMNFSAKTRKECLEWVRKTCTEIGDGMSVVSAQITLSEYLDEWLDWEHNSDHTQDPVSHNLLLDE